MATVIPFPVARIRVHGDPDWAAIDAAVEELERERGLGARERERERQDASCRTPRLRLVAR